MSAETATAAPSSSRLLSLDAFRGATILGMILVNNPGSWGALYPPLAHADWLGWTPTDLVFPFFLFIMGTAVAYAMRKYRHGAVVDAAAYRRIARRTLTLIALGLAIGLFGRLCAIIWQGADGWHLDTLRWPGVLQRIGLVYCAVSLVALHLDVRKQVALAAALLLGYWAMLAWLPTDVDPAERITPTGNVVRAVDLAVIGKNHMYTQATTEPTEPEGLLSTLPAIVTGLAGYWAGLAIQRRGAAWRTVVLLAVAGAVVAAAGLAWDVWFPISKKLWTSSFVLLTAGLASVCLAAFLAVFDVLGFRRLARPLEIVGVNAIFAYVGSGLLARLWGSIPVGERSLHDAVYEAVFLGPIGNAKLASLACALATVGLWWIILALMARRGWAFRI